MWKNSCTWKLGVKYAVSSLVLIAFAFVLIYPSPKTSYPKGAVELYGDEQKVEVYGPELPEAIVEGYSAAKVNSVVAAQEDSGEKTVHVYAAEGAQCYHLEKCKFAYASAQCLTVYEAYMLGYEPCGLCKPPVYSQADNAVVANPASTGTDATGTDTTEQ